MRRIADFDVDDVSECSDVLRGLGGGVPTMEGAASRIAKYLYDEFAGDDGARALALARVYKTHPYEALPPDLQDFVGGLAHLCDDRTVITVENPSFATLLTETQFDTIRVALIKVPPGSPR